MLAADSLLSILVPTRNQGALLKTLIDSVEPCARTRRIELIVVDNGSDDPSSLQYLDRLRERTSESGFERIRVLSDARAFNYSRLNNLAASEAEGTILCLLNDDIEALSDSDWIGPMLAQVARPDVGCVGALLLYPDNTIQHAGVVTGFDGLAGHRFKGLPREAADPGGLLSLARRVSAVTAACLMIRKPVFDQVGGFDERLPVAWNDVDLCLRVDAAGYANVWTPEAVLYHHESKSRGRSGQRSSRQKRQHAAATRYLRRKWGTRLDHDPYAELPDSGMTAPRVAVVLCTYNGERYLGAQLDSLLEQSWSASVLVHDDASSDGTVTIANAHPAVERCVAHVDNVGYVKNFERGIADALAQDFDYIALCDQDDIWESGRIEEGLSLIRATEQEYTSNYPVLVHSDLSIVAADGSMLHPSFLTRRGYRIDDRPDLARVLGENGVMGNTILMNRALARLSMPFPAELHVHDWWLALLAELYGRRRLHTESLVRYRTHENNASNPAGSIAPGSLRIVRRLTWRRLLGRDFRLPYLEDSRRHVLERLIHGDNHRPVPNASARRLIAAFLDYLDTDGSAWRRFMAARRHQFLRSGAPHRLRVGLALLFSRRYRVKHDERNG